MLLLQIAFTLLQLGNMHIFVCKLCSNFILIKQTILIHRLIETMYSFPNPLNCLENPSLAAPAVASFLSIIRNIEALLDTKHYLYLLRI